jgi:hypothetical protein
MSNPSGNTMTVRVVDRGTGAGYQFPVIRTVTVATTCPTCGGDRGTPYPHRFSEDGEWMTCDRWDNPCGHIDYYGAVLAEVREQAGSVTRG